jgi:hypothetical protein
MAKTLKTVYLKLPAEDMRAIERIADSQFRTTSAQVALIIQQWLEKFRELPKPEQT